jgi:hypothetical protein
MQNQAVRPLSILRATDKTDKDFDPSVDKLIPSSSGQPTSLSPDPAAIYKRRAARQGQQQPMGKARKRATVPATEYLRAMTEPVDVAHPVYPKHVFHVSGSG